jgi:hypothetical protein
MLLSVCFSSLCFQFLSFLLNIDRSPSDGLTVDELKALSELASSVDLKPITETIQGRTSALFVFFSLLSAEIFSFPFVSVLFVACRSGHQCSTDQHQHSYDHSSPNPSPS